MYALAVERSREPAEELLCIFEHLQRLKTQREAKEREREREDQQRGGRIKTIT